MHLDMGWYKHEDVKCWVSKDNGADLSELTSELKKCWVWFGTSLN